MLTVAMGINNYIVLHGNTARCPLTFLYRSSFQLLIDRDVCRYVHNTCNLNYSVSTFKHPKRDVREKCPPCNYGESSIISVYIKPMMSPFLALVHFVRLDS